MADDFYVCVGLGGRPMRVSTLLEQYGLDDGDRAAVLGLTDIAECSDSDLADAACSTTIDGRIPVSRFQHHPPIYGDKYKWFEVCPTCDATDYMGHRPTEAWCEPCDCFPLTGGWIAELRAHPDLAGFPWDPHPGGDIRQNALGATFLELGMRLVLTTDPGAYRDAAIAQLLAAYNAASAALHATDRWT